jgi:hypothetical protein
MAIWRMMSIVGQPVMPGAAAVAKTIADTVIARMPPRLA